MSGIAAAAAAVNAVAVSCALLFFSFSCVSKHAERGGTRTKEKKMLSKQFEDGKRRRETKKNWGGKKKRKGRERENLCSGTTVQKKLQSSFLRFWFFLSFFTVASGLMFFLLLGKYKGIVFRKIKNQNEKEFVGFRVEILENEFDIQGNWGRMVQVQQEDGREREKVLNLKQECLQEREIAMFSDCNRNIQFLD